MRLYHSSREEIFVSEIENVYVEIRMRDLRSYRSSREEIFVSEIENV